MEKFALVTGCSQGNIGAALAMRLRQSGFTTFATVLPHESQKHVIKKDIHVITADVTSDSDTEKLIGELDLVCKGRLDVLITNAGICYTMPATDTDVQQVEKMFAVNVFGPMRMVKSFHKHVLATKGTIVNIRSVSSIVPYVFGASYNASKAALHHYGNTLRVEMKPFGLVRKET